MVIKYRTFPLIIPIEFKYIYNNDVDRMYAYMYDEVAC